MTDAQNEMKSQIWMLTALVYGYNQLAAMQTVLGDKVFCRLAREKCVSALESLGCTIDRSKDCLPVLTIPRFPRVNFNPEDIELMRAVVAEHDAKEAAKAAESEE